MIRLRKSFVLFIVLGIIFSFTTSAWALQYANVEGYNNEFHTAWGNYQWNGTFGYNYIQSS